MWAIINKKQRLSQFKTIAILLAAIFLGVAISSGRAAPAPDDSVGDFVWYDLDANGIQDSGEPGIYGVTVELFASGGVTALQTKTTNASGYYVFEGLATPADYYIEFTAPGDLEFSAAGVGDPALDSDANVGTGQTAVFTVPAGPGKTDIDAGLHPPTTVGDKVWNDLNANGIQDAGEPGLGGVFVELFTEGGSSAGTDTTEFDGSYSITSASDGNHYIEFTAPTGFIFSPKDQGIDTIDSDADVGTGETAVFNITAGTAKDDVDAGLFQPATIGNYVWDDLNGNGEQDIGESGIENVLVTLYNTSDVEVDSMSTTATGHYTFTNVVPNTYYLHFTGPTGYLASPQSQTTDDKDSDIDTITFKTSNFSVAFGEVQVNKDAGFFDPGAIGDFIWEDLNGDGVQDSGENGIGGVTLQLYRDKAPFGSFGGDEPVGSPVTTTSAGVYDFTNLPSGAYWIDITDTGGVLTGYGITFGSDPQLVNLPPGTDYNDADFGFQESSASIGDLVWNDLDGDGVQDGGGEVGISNVTLQLYKDVAPVGTLDGSDTPVGSPVTTSGTGAYDFPNLVAGKYIVEVTDTSNVLTNYGLTGGTEPRFVTITADQDYNGADFGYQLQNAKIGNFLWNDLDGNGIFDGSDAGIDGVSIQLYKDVAPIGTLDGGDTAVGTPVTTASGGAYEFANLGAGTYLVSVTDTSGPLTGFAITSGTNPFAVTLTASENNETTDFGYQQQDATIGGLVWNDADGSGTKEVIEVGINGVTLQLYRDAVPIGTLGVEDTAVGSPVTTASGGTFDFTKLAAGTYIVDVTDTGSVLDGFNNVGSTDPMAVSITAGQDYNDANFGYKDSETASIGDFVWNDLDGDGVQDGGGEVGIGSVTLQLHKDVAPIGTLGGGDTPVGGPVTTSGAGAYDFTNLPAGTYIVEVTDTGNVLTDYGLTGGTEPLPVNLKAGQDYNGADFGYQLQNAKIGDFLWNDLDGNGTFDGSDVGIDGVSIRLYKDVAPIGTLGGGDTAVGSPVVTASGGAYEFTGLAAGTYLVSVTDTSGPLTGFAITSGTNPFAVTLTASENNETTDFGYQQQNASIGGLVWNDADSSGTKEVSEVGINGVTLQLYRDAVPIGTLGVEDTAVGSPVTTASGGTFDFTKLPAGTYIVDVTDTGYVLDGFDNVGSTDPMAVSITAGQDYNDANFGYKDSETASIGDFVWNDLDGDGVQDGGEPGIDGVTIDLIDDANGNKVIDNGESVLSTETTSGGGAYDFTGLLAGDYILKVTDTSNELFGFTLTTAFSSMPVTVSAGQNYDDADFGYKDPTNSMIGDFVWNDRNGDGVQDAGEPGIAGVTISLIGAGLDDTFSTSDDVTYPDQTTDANGAYNFTGLTRGMYRVNVGSSSLPAGVALTGGTIPHNYTLAVGEDYNDADFGYQGDASISGTVWLDDDANGTQDAGEGGIASVVAYLDLDDDNQRDANEPFATTNGSGVYTMTGLTPGSYTLRVDLDTVSTDYALSTNAELAIILLQGETHTGADFGFRESFEVFMPIVLNNYVPAPDLVVTSIEASSNLIEVVVENQGSGPTTAGFWVDFYIDPDPVPTHENQSWSDVADEGVVWGIDVGLMPGDVITLTYSTDPTATNEFYSDENSMYSGTLTAGTAIYAQVDSVHLGTSYGGILETHEIYGDAYNNILGGTASASSGIVVENTAVSIPEQALLLPSRN